MILKQNLDVFVQKYIRTISFAFHFLELTPQSADWGAIVFGSWVHVNSNRRPKLPGRKTLQTRLWKGLENRGFRQIQFFFTQML